MSDQPFSLLQNLAKTEAPSSERTDGKVAFVSAMEKMGISSVFDIVRRAKPAFVRELLQYSDANGDLAYENARCYATQIVRLYRNQLVSSGRTQNLTQRTGVRSLVDIGPSFPNLFKENWDLFCKVGTIEAKDSPAAYLTALYRFAMEELEGSSAETNRIHLDARRPDLKDLLIDQQTTYTPLSTLEIVNTVLEKAIMAYTGTVDGLKGKSIYQLVSEKQHPFQFPYNFHHQQISLGLAGKKPILGELSYRISFQVPATSPGNNAYGAVQSSSNRAQMMMSGTGPEQQALVLAPALPEADETLITQFFKNKYGTLYISGAGNPLNSLKIFNEKTGLPGDAVEALLATGDKAPHPSPNVQAAGAASTPETGQPTDSGIAADHSAKYGASYVNGPTATAAMALGLDAQQNRQLLNTSLDRFDRMQRMIRLQRWLDIPFAPLDTLVMAIIRSEGAANAGSVLNENTLRALGVYRYLSRHYSIEPEAFAGFFHQLSAYASQGRLSMYDRVFNNPILFDTPLVLNGSPIWLTSGDSPSNKTLAQICAALGLEYTRESLWPILTDTRDAYAGADKPLLRTLSMMSSMYRQARIASMFGLSAAAGRALVDLLGGESYRSQVVKGTVRNTTGETAGEASPADLLDILMQMDWAVRWLNETGRDVWTLRRQLAVDTFEPTVSQSLLDQLEQLGKDASESVLTEPQLRTLSLPAKDDNDATIDWWGTVLAPLVDTHGLVKALPLTLEGNVAADIDTLLAVQLEPVALDAITKETARTRLGEYLFKGYVIQHRLMEGLLLASAGVPLDRCETVMRWAGTSADVFLGTAIDTVAGTSLSLPLAAGSEELIAPLMTLHRYAEVNQQLGLSAQALRTFLVNPEWLHVSLTAPLTLSLTSLYVLDRYRHWRDNCGQPESALLAYFMLANNGGTPGQCDAQLALLTRWSTTELARARTQLGSPARSMHQVDWLKRMQDTCALTGLSADQLLAATELTSASTLDQWKKVGDDVMGTSR
ncbi:Tc toxin subunit A [Pseudomonas sp. NPDC089734]|uniref:Tc toxin subunit A n=1 Tax=Pseudomonas sp. NPDC089734 TaxID=3364469 RepID=UPI00381A1B7E